MRDFNASLIAPALRATGFRFDKSYRHGDTKIKALIYRLVNTVKANLKADGY
jgi:hypothetical protein